MSDAQAVEGGGGPSNAAAPQSFADFTLRTELREAIASMGYDQPTVVQAAVFGPAMEGRDLAVQARTGSGKTAAFGIPIVERLEAHTARPGFPHALILTPTRELAVQVANEIKTLGSKTGVGILAVYGGVPISRQTVALQQGVEIVVGTPGRLLDHIRRGNLALSEAKAVVLDEADEMLSMGFWDDVTELLSMAPQSRQTMLFSATLPYEVARAAAQYLKDPARLDLSGDHLTVEEIENCIYHVVADIPKPRQLLYLLEAERPVNAIIFCNTRNEAEMMAKYLTQSGFVAEALTGNFRQADRERVMHRIKVGDLRYMIATDVAARGIDINDLSHVINYSLPEFSEVYLHRVGRTGRVGKDGVAISLVDGRGLGTLSVLERRFGIKFTIKALPPEQEALRRRSERIMKELSERASVAEVGQHLPVAQEILGSTGAAQVVAFLLKSYFNAQATAVDRRPAARGVAGARVAPAAQESPAAAAGAPTAAATADTADTAGETGGRRRRRRSRRRRRRGDSNGGEFETADAPETGDELGAANGDGHVVVGDSPAAADINPDANGLVRLRVNIGYDDGFKGRGAVAKKIAALAGLNDGIVTEVDARRTHSVLQATPDIAELVVDRVDGAQLGKKILVVSRAD